MIVYVLLFFSFLVCFFFFLQHKTADEMRIRDWSSDVCSSDLARAGRRPHRRERRAGTGAAAGGTRLRVDQGPRHAGGGGLMAALLDSLAAGFDGNSGRKAALDAVVRDGLPGPRSEAWKYT